MVTNPGQIAASNSVTLNQSSTLTLVGANTLSSLTFDNNGGVTAPTVTTGGLLTLSSSTPLTVTSSNAFVTPLVSGTMALSAGANTFSIGAIQVVRRLSMHSDPVVARVLIVAHALRVLSIVALGLTGELGVAILARWSAAGLSSISAPLLDTWLARNTPSEVRATVFSAISQGDALGQVLGGPAIGAIGSWVSLRAAMLASAVLLLPGLLVINRAGRVRPVVRV